MLLSSDRRPHSSSPRTASEVAVRAWERRSATAVTTSTGVLVQKVAFQVRSPTGEAYAAMVQRGPVVVLWSSSIAARSDSCRATVVSCPGL